MRANAESARYDQKGEKWMENELRRMHSIGLRGRSAP